MPSGTTHDRITLWTLPWVASITYGLTRNGDLTLLVSGGFLFSGLMFGPDLDIRSIQFQRWGLLRGIWLPYRKLLRHRSLFSHGLIIGTCLRVLYLFLFVAGIAIFVVGFAQLLFGFSWNWQDFVGSKFHLLTHHRDRETIALFMGLELGAMSHSISDWISSSHKKRLNKKPRKTVKVTKIKR
ncbi:metal-binding protein [Waterburya agarophytonicola K14]|uniref:Metal-binding protein n=1 Tax=Waterburya agarophytonicola KI4 TaxID=2874699 RepID=A0A964BQ92_9CYAN|nr:metal-binding protein [Waterburya agarophytonicola]MCC0177309.1 metal-binding protein [Waterburya agarophytonicola KI4]